ncbi:uncharacterized protein PgNI_09241 [Pyricularia grisea]|uniref:Uncharacterized protein n=1 Tax=Pyricularia grisea TaxID=148305 RepID=A0A6P8AS87_PYRGI|nr:uncharacterized protein PgNI_09241 [Pyricularia grisea]TLD04991.1 hypothetical protein PgNI_09241 [Pyricularia grisea]
MQISTISQLMALLAIGAPVFAVKGDPPVSPLPEVNPPPHASPSAHWALAKNGLLSFPIKAPVAEKPASGDQPKNVQAEKKLQRTPRFKNHDYQADESLQSPPSQGTQQGSPKAPANTQNQRPQNLHASAIRDDVDYTPPSSPTSSNSANGEKPRYLGSYRKTHFRRGEDSRRPQGVPAQPGSPRASTRGRKSKACKAHRRH